MAEGKIVAFVALPEGWRNLSTDEDHVISSPCPGVLLFEDGDYPVFAMVDTGVLMPVSEDSTYWKTVPPGDLTEYA